MRSAILTLTNQLNSLKQQRMIHRLSGGQELDWLNTEIEEHEKAINRLTNI